MKIKVTLLLVVILMVAFAGTAYAADTYDPGTDAMLITDVWFSGTLQDSVEAQLTLHSATVNDIASLTITAPDTITNADKAYILSLPELTTLVIANTVDFSDTGVDFFRANSKIEHVTIPSTVIGESSFRNCDALLTLTLPNAVTLNANTVRGNLKLHTLSMPSATTFLYRSISANDALTSLTLLSAQTFANQCIYDNSALSVLILPEALTAGNDFGRDNNLTSVTAPKLHTLGQYNFTNNDSLTTITLESAQTFGRNLLSGCALLQEVYLPQATTLPYRAFNNDDALSYVYAPMVTDFANQIFRRVDTAVNLELGSTLPAMSVTTAFNSFGPFAGSTVSVPINMVDDYDAAEGAADDGLWYGFTILGVIPEPVANPRTGDTGSSNFGYVIALLLVLGVAAFSIRRKTAAKGK